MGRGAGPSRHGERRDLSECDFMSPRRSRGEPSAFLCWVRRGFWTRVKDSGRPRMKDARL